SPPSGRLNTLVTTARECLLHQGFPEQPERLAAIHRRLGNEPGLQVQWCEPGDASPLTLVHPAEWIYTIAQRAARSEDAGEEVPMVPASWPAILAATSALITATDHALDNRARSFAAVRPPGHHASA